MTLKQIIDTRTPIKMRVITYARDGNTVVIHHEQGYPIIGNFYVFPTKPDKYGGYFFQFVVYYPSCGYALRCESASQWQESDERYDWPNYLPAHSYYAGTEEGFITQMDARMRAHSYIQAAEIRMLKEILSVMRVEGHADVAPYVAYKKQITQEREEKLKREREAREAKRLEEERLAREEHERKLCETAELLRKGGTQLRLDFDCMLELAERLNVPFPLKLKGWVRKELKAVDIVDGDCPRYWLSRHSKSRSTTIGFYMNRLLAALQENPKAGCLSS